MDIVRSSRHSKIAGDFGEALILYWLSKYGFECACVDHTGIDLIARNPYSNELMGISVKSRTRSAGKEAIAMRIPDDDFEKAGLACEAFDCVPYFAIVVDASDLIRTFLLPLDHLRNLCGTSTGANWKMSVAALLRYAADPQIKTFELKTNVPRWWHSNVVVESDELE